MDWQDSQLAAVEDDVGLLRAMAEQARAALAADDHSRAAACSRACATLALSIAGRLESVGAYRMGLRDAVPRVALTWADVEGPPEPGKRYGRKPLLHEFRGERLSAVEIGRRLGFSANTIRLRIRDGEPLEGG